MGSLPNFIVIGAGRSGTTSLHNYLAQHPEIYLSPYKSPNYFVAQDPQPHWENRLLKTMAKHWVSTREAYEALFHGVRNERAIGEVSPVYLQSIHTAKRMKETLPPSTKFIAILRNPVDRAYAHFLGRRRDGLEPCDDFNKIVERELAQPLPDDIAFGSYIGCGRYSHFLEPFYSHFSRDNIRIYLFDQIQEDLSGLMGELFSFLGVNPTFQVNTTVSHNRSGIIRNPNLRLLWTRSVALRTTMRPYLPAWIRHLARPILAEQVFKPSLDVATRKSIALALQEDMERLEPLTGVDISHWLSAESHVNAQS